MPGKRTSMKQRRGMDAIFESAPAKAPAPAPAATENDKQIKFTVLLPEYIHWGIEQIQLNERRRTGEKPEKYLLAKEAFDLLLAKYGINPEGKSR